MANQDKFEFEVKPKPQPSESNLIQLVSRLYGLRVGSTKELNGYDDANYWIKCSEIDNPFVDQIWPHGYVLKIMNESDSKNEALIEAQNNLMIHLGKHKFDVPQPVKNIHGKYYSLEVIEHETGHPSSKNIVRLLTYQLGTLLKDAEQSPELYLNVGIYLGDFTIAMRDFKEAALMERMSPWSLGSCTILRDLVYVVEDSERKSLVTRILDQFTQIVLPQMDKLEKGIIHGDFNEHNILVKGNQVISLIDFGDSHFAPILFEIAICLCYILLQGGNIGMCKYILAGLTRRRKLSKVEIHLLKVCICGRLCQSLVLGLYTYSKNPKNEYVLSSQNNGWRQLQMLVSMEQHVLETTWGLSCS